jgi:hypothetical protein
VRFADGNDVIVGGLRLQHQPHRFDVVAGETPVALGVEISQEQILLNTQLDAGCGFCDLARHERLAAP